MVPSIFIKKTISIVSRRLILITLICGTLFYIWFLPQTDKINVNEQQERTYQHQPKCTCSRPKLNETTSYLTKNETNSQQQQHSLCSDYATMRGPHQRVISISVFGPQENKMFQMNRSLTFLYQLIDDLNEIYPDNFILRIYHDNTLSSTDFICPIECRHKNVDFCNVSAKSFIPPKIWRFLPVGDPLVDIVMSRDLDSPLTIRERTAVNEWLSSNYLFHSMRDHPQHGVPMLGGMWGFRPALNSTIARLIHDKIHNQNLIKKFGGRGDQTFLANEVWPYAKSSVIAHDSFLCHEGYGVKSRPFPTQRPSANETNCFIGCVRPCCVNGKMPFGECPVKCRPKEHQDWIYC